MILRSSSERTLILDLDGTLIDSQNGIERSYKYLCETLSLPQPTIDEVRSFIGPPLERTLREHFALGQRDVEQAKKIFRDFYKKDCLLDFRKYDFAGDALLQLYENGVNLFIATSKREDMASQIIKSAGWGELLTKIYGSSSSTGHEKLQIIKRLLADQHIDRGFAIYIGDRKDDALASQQTGLNFIGACWGYGSITELKTAGAVNLLMSLETLPEVVKSMLD